MCCCPSFTRLRNVSDAKLDGFVLLWRSSSEWYRLGMLQKLTEANENKFYKAMKIETPADLRKALLKHD